MKLKERVPSQINRTLKLVPSACVAFICLTTATEANAQIEQQGVSVQACGQLGLEVLNHRGEAHVGACANYARVRTDEFVADLYPGSVEAGFHYDVINTERHGHEDHDHDHDEEGAPPHIRLTLGLDANIAWVSTSAGTGIIGHGGGISARLGINDFGLGGGFHHSINTNSTTEARVHGSWRNFGVGAIKVTPHLPEIIEAAIGHNHGPHTHSSQWMPAATVRIGPDQWRWRPQVQVAGLPQGPFFGGITLSRHIGNHEVDEDPINEDAELHEEHEVEREAATHVHLNGEVCTGDHNDDHSGHDHSSHDDNPDNDDKDEHHDEHSHPLEFHFHPIF